MHPENSADHLTHAKMRHPISIVAEASPPAYCLNTAPSSRAGKHLKVTQIQGSEPHTVNVSPILSSIGSLPSNNSSDARTNAVDPPRGGTLVSLVEPFTCPLRT